MPFKKSANAESVYTFTPTSTTASSMGQYRAQFIIEFLTPDYLETIAQIIRDDSVLLELITLQLYEHLEKVFKHKLTLTIQENGVDAVDLKHTTHFRLTQDTAIPVELDLDAKTVKDYLRSSLLGFFEQDGFKEKFAKAIATNILSWALDELESESPSLETLTQAEILQSIGEYIDPRNSKVLEDKINLFSEVYSQDITQKIIDSLQLPNCDITTIERFLGLRQPPIASARSTLDLSPIVPVPTAIPIASSLKAQLRTDLWERDVDDIAVFRYQSKANASNFIEHNITNPGDIALLPWEAAEQIINKFGFDTVKLQLILAARTMDEAEPWKNAFTLKASDIVHLLGWDRNHTTSLSEKRKHVAATAYALSCLLVRSVWIEGRGKRKIDASTPIGRMWDVLIDPHGQIDLTSGKIENPEEIYITVVPGLWTKHFLNRAGNKAKEALNQFGYLARDILRIDPYHNELALRLAIQLTVDSRVRAHSKNPYLYRVYDLLREVLARQVIDDALNDKYKARDLRKRWDNSLELLISLGWVIEFEPDTYPSWFQPNSKQKKPKDWRRVRLIERLMNAKLTIKPPGPIPDLLSRLKETKLFKQLEVPVVAERLTSEKVAVARKQKGWSRKELAGFLGISADYVGKIERGNRQITDELEQRIKSLLQP